MNTHLPALLEEGLYHADGQIDGEVYEYGSFLQSRMFHAGVTCSDCHEPHSLKLRAEGDGICARCHAAEKYDKATHHHHTVDSPGSHCVDCHMPAKAYMVIDPRRDHSFRIPRPDFSVQLGTPNACNGCHVKRSASWAADTLRRWLGRDPGGYQRFAQALHSARSGAPEAKSKLLELLRETDQPAVARATAAAELALWPSPDIEPAVEIALADANPLIRAGGLRALESLPPDRRAELGLAMLDDPVRLIRALAGASLADIPPANLPSRLLPRWERATEDYLAAQILNADEPGAQVNIGNFYAGRGQIAQAESAYREALALNPDWVPAYVNLIDLLRESGQEQGSEALLLQGLSRQPRAAALHHALGLLQVRRKDLSAALVSLKRAVELAPENARFVYVFAVALDSAQRHKEAMSTLKTGLQHSPSDRALQQLWSLWSGNESAPR
ncbi:cytochrome c3 family protein [Methyloterricola oryzae]|uniref:cytochrome c3 family protein n=1 Tax=Methyloterricola oryzae TaxID=1495050 RepID=UPI00130178FF|nr:cytochrome c3 family protein [Methyloterricola oryzae]